MLLRFVSTISSAPPWHTRDYGSNLIDGFDLMGVWDLGLGVSHCIGHTPRLSNTLQAVAQRNPFALRLQFP
jgi:hypothetical protein